MFVLFAQESARVTYQFTRLQAWQQWWHVPLVVAVVLLVAAAVVMLYRRDSVELRPAVSISLLVLRLAALAGVLLYYLQLEQRTERSSVENSRVLMLVDTSLSMEEPEAAAATSPSAQSRIGRVQQELAAGALLAELRAKHDVEIVRFDRDSASLAVLPKREESASPEASSTENEPGDTPKWSEALAARGVETRLGQALRQWLMQRRGVPLSGLVVFSDGGQNAGVDPVAALEVARAEQVPIHAVGLGSPEQAVNVRLVDLRAPARAYPGDAFTIGALVQSQGLADREVQLQLSMREATEGEQAAGDWRALAKKSVVTGTESVPVEFEVPAINEQQRYVFRLAIDPIAGDESPDDNAQEADVEIVDRKDRVLLLAGGPTREYQFLRNQLRRDKSMTVDVLLQTAQPGISQDANAILDAFPSKPEEMAVYDCVVAFDADWRRLTPEQRALLERWVAEMAGGLIVVAGPVYTGQWAQDAELAAIRDLYPVEFHRRQLLLDEGRYGSEEPATLQFTREGREADFLRLADTAAASNQAWESFPGVYGFYDVRGEKPGATVYLRYGDVAGGDELPVYLAGHYYAAGRVFYLGSGEMWRLRAIDDNFFDQFYTKLIRQAASGRLLRGSGKDNLIVEDRHLLGDTVTVRAQMSTAQHEPLARPEVALEVWSPDNVLRATPLRLDPTRAGLYTGQFPATREGTYRLVLPTEGGEPVTQRIQVRVPDLEGEDPRRNDPLLASIASATGGHYFRGMDEALGQGNQPSLASQLKDRSRTSFALDSPNLDWERQWMTCLLVAICGCLLLEWTIRRLSRLA